MTALSQTPASVHLFSDTTVALVQAGEAISPGMPVYLKSDGKYYKSISSGATEANAVGIAASYAPAADVYFVIAKTGSIDLGGTMGVGTSYVVGAVAGEIDPEADLTTGNYPTTIGRAKTATELVLNFKAAGIPHA